MKSLKLAKYSEKFEYRSDGTLVYKVNCKNKKQGDVAGYINSNGYIKISLSKNTKEYAHRIIWYLHNGKYEGVIDHINGIKTDNRIENLRMCTQRENTRNRTKQIHRKHNLPRNVYAQKNNRFRVMLAIDGEQCKSFGSFATVEEAASRAEEMRKLYYGEYAGQETTKNLCGTSKRLSDVTETYCSDRILVGSCS